MKINPCPNPECDGISNRGTFCPPIVETDVRYQTAAVRCPVCNITGPECNAGGAPAARNAIAAWNSIGMGWRNPETAPKDGTLIQATMRTAKWVHVLWIERSPDAVEGEESGWFCPESGVEYWGSDLLGWRSIPPLPEGEP
jgi:hypothetical protein